MNIEIQFLDCNLSPLANRKILFTPVKSPEISSSWLTTADSYQFSSSNLGILSASIVANNYVVDITSPTPETKFYLSVSETGSYIYSGSFKTGSAQDVFFDLFNLVKDTKSVRKLTLTPVWNYPFAWSGSIVTLNSTSSIPVNGYAEFASLVPGVYLCDVLGKVDTTFYISVPAHESAYFDWSPKWNAKDLLIVKPSKGIPVKLYNGDSSYVLTVSSSDARYVFRGENISASVTYAEQAGSASWASSSISSSYALSASWAPTPITLTSGNGIIISGSSVNAIQTGSYPVGYLPYSDTAHSLAFDSNLAYNPGDGLQVTTGNFGTLQATTLNAVNATITGNLNATASKAISSSYSNTASYALNGGTTLATGSTYPITASWATTASYALTSSYELEVEISSSWASASLSSSYALTASYAMNANFGNLDGGFPDSIYGGTTPIDGGTV